MINLNIKNKHYRLTLTDEDTHEGLHVFKFSMISIIAGSILSLLGIIGLVYALLVFTPLHFSIPGYPDAHFRRQATSNAIKIDSLESALTRWELYATNISRVLDGKQGLNLDSIMSPGSTQYLSNQNSEYLRKQDSLLKMKVAREEQFALEDTKREMPIEGIHFFTPIKGVVTNKYERAIHPAIDISAPAGSVIKSVLEGTVIYSGWSDEYGYTITLQHSGDLISTYKHNRKLLKEAGDKVQAGTPIALLGNTGNTSNGDHLHFELWHRGEAIDPSKYISF